MNLYCIAACVSLDQLLERVHITQNFDQAALLCRVFTELFQFCMSRLELVQNVAYELLHCTYRLSADIPRSKLYSTACVNL